MNDKCFVDTNILVYAHDREAGAKHDKARTLIEDLWRTGSGVISTQVLQELCVCVRRKAAQPLGLAATRDIVTDYLAWEVVIITGQSVLDALEIEQRYGISFWDALVIHAAERAGASILYSEDLSEDQMYGTVRAVNPFREVASAG